MWDVNNRSQILGGKCWRYRKNKLMIRLHILVIRIRDFEPIAFNQIWLLLFIVKTCYLLYTLNTLAIFENIASKECTEIEKWGVEEVKKNTPNEKLTISIWFQATINQSIKDRIECYFFFKMDLSCCVIYICLKLVFPTNFRLCSF